jgi:hypothetical protein
MAGLRQELSRISESETVAALSISRPGLALTVAAVMALPPIVRVCLEALGLR